MLKLWTIPVSLGCLAVLAIYVVAFPPRGLDGTDLASCPLTLAGLPGMELDMEQAVLDDLDPDDYLIRRYDRPDGSPVWLTIVYFQNARLGAHDPQLCYRSQGFRIEPQRAEVLATGLGAVPIEGFLAEKGPRREVVRYFWYTSGGRTMSDVKGWRDSMFFQGLRSNRSFGAFIRISTLEGNDPEEAREALNRVIQDLAPRLPGFFPEGARAEEGRG